MKTNNLIYKALSLVALLCLGQTAAWGDDAVTGNKYSDVDSRVIQADLTGGTGWESDYGRDPHPYRYAYDNSADTYAQQANHNTNPTLTFDLNNHTLAEIEFTSHPKRNEPHPQRLIVESRNSNYEQWTQVQEFEFTRLNVKENVILNNPITSSQVRLTFVVNDDNNNRLVQIHNVVLYSEGNEPTIQHKDAKWFDLKEKLGLDNDAVGSFNYDQRRFTADMSVASEGLQATHTYIDTIYVHKGSNVKLILPTSNKSDGTGTSSVWTYQRWYSYRTDKTFATNGSDGVYDLLTPNNNKQAYRFTNGYVGKPLSDDIVQSMTFHYPTEAEFEKWFPNSQVDNDWYVVACDVSGYTDFSKDFDSKGNEGNHNEDGQVTKETILANAKTQFTDEGYYEPTLALRVIYYIVGVDDRDMPEGSDKKANWDSWYGKLTTSDYQGGTTEEGKKYLEEYDITFPNKHLSNYTCEVLSLSKDAHSYAIPDVDEDEPLTVKIVSNNAGIRLVSNNQNNYESYGETCTLSGIKRTIQFAAEGGSLGQPWKVTDGSTATIIVTKKCDNGITYNIARFKLTFTADAVPYTQSQLANIPSNSSEIIRTPQWLTDNRRLLTQLNFDYDEKVAAMYGQEEYFPFPLAWDNSSYAFFDGSPWQDFISGAYYTISNGYYWYPEFGYYALTNDYIGYGDQGDRNNARPPLDDEGNPSIKGKSNYHIYVDASDRPGVLARLPFDEKLCVGSELFVTAWIKSAGSKDNDDAAVLFTVMGVTNKEDGSQLYTPLYRHSSGQIRTTTWLNAGDAGTGERNNEWYQVYFSFMNTNELASTFDSYVLQVENNSASTTGGDYYLDDIRVYIAQPNATVTQKEYSCTNERTRMNIELDWERLMSRLGTEDAEGDNGISFCFYDEMTYETTYNAYIAEHGGENASADDVNAAKLAAITASVQPLGDQTTYDRPYATLYFKNKFDDNKQYGTDEKHYFARDNYDASVNRYYFYKTEDSDNGRRITVDFYSNLSPNRPYNMIILPATLEDDATQELAMQDFAEQIGNPCLITTRFYVESETLVKVNGEVLDPTTDFCAGQVFNFSAQMRYPTGEYDSEGMEIYKVIESGVYYDWFFGTEEEYLTDNDTYGTNLDVALTNFRGVYPDATSLDGVEVNKTSEDGALTFTQADYDIINHYLNTDAPAGGINKKLVLHKENLNITILEGGLEVVIKPIQTYVAPEESGLSNDQWAAICWEYVPLALTVDDRAPKLFAGFNIVNYPAKDFAPALRIGLAQIKQATNEENALRVDLRDAETVTTGADYLGPIDTQDDMRHIYLVATDDPRYDKWFDAESAEEFDRTSLPIGDIIDLYAEKSGEGSEYNDHMNITFNLNRQTINGEQFQFDPREGYTYTFATYFEEKSRNSGEIYNTCYGSFNIEMKVVPEYLVWKGGANDNWNNDANWKRAKGSDLKITDGSYTDYADDELTETGNGFVPMLFSNVVMPEESRVELYMTGYINGGAAWQENQKPQHIGDPTTYIQYDLMAYADPETNDLTTQRYRVNICRDIHFAPDAQMLHAEQLLYNKAWMDVNLPTRQWTLVSTPLKDVVSGDWYTSTTGTQTDLPYFEDITFGQKNDRRNPAVYQRSWDKNATIVKSPINNSNGTVGFSTSTPVWSAAYNDASVPYVAGGGYSLSARDVTSGNGTLSFRFPKADTQYDYSTGTLDRTNSGKLLVSGLLDRSDPLQLLRHDDVTQTLTPSQDGKYMIVGNPYMAPLDLQKFFEVNTGEDGNLTGQYWSETSEGSAMGGTDATGGKWLTPTGTETIAPFGAFFVQLKDGATNTIKFTADMQKFEQVQGEGTAFTITADNGSEKSRAILAYADNANNDYADTEDTQLMRDLLGNNANELSVYTVAGDVAASINRVKDLQKIPLGLFATEDAQTTLTFKGVSTLKEPTLYDASQNTSTPITEGMTLDINGSSHGRYYICSLGEGNGTTGIDEITSTEEDVKVTSPAHRQIMVTANNGIESVSVYSANGTLLRRVSPKGETTCTIDGVASGVAVVMVKTANNNDTFKIIIK